MTYISFILGLKFKLLLIFLDMCKGLVALNMYFVQQDAIVKKKHVPGILTFMYTTTIQ